MNSDLKLTINVDDKDATFALGDTGTRTKKPDIETHFGYVVDVNYINQVIKVWVSTVFNGFPTGFC